MGFNISQLPAYTNEQSTKFMLKSVLGANTISLLTGAGSFMPELKGSEAIQLMDKDVYFQDGSNCGRNPQGGVTFGQAEITAKRIKSNENYCVADLESKYTVEELKAKMKGQVYDDLIFNEVIAEAWAEKAALEVEQMIWLGDTALTGSTTPNLKLIDGFVKRVVAATDKIALPNTGSTITAKLQAIYFAMPVAVRKKEDFRIFISEEMHDKYVAENQAPTLFKDVDTTKLVGTSAKLEPVSGLNETGVVIAARLRNLRAGGDLKNMDLNKWYSQETDSVNLDAKFSLGTQIIYPQEIGYVKIP